jgi:hypothetical protein
MSPTPAAKATVDPLAIAFDTAPWDDRPATEEEVEAMCEARAAEDAGTAGFVPGAEISALISERTLTKE